MLPVRRSFLALTFLALPLAVLQPAGAETYSVGPRPLALVDQMADGPLKDKLLACAREPVKRTLFSISHRGAPLQFPEHTKEGYVAAARMGAGIIECDVTFTKDKELVCRHAQNDLHTSTNILATGLAGTCAEPFTPAAGGDKATAECRTSDISLEEFKTLRGKMDAGEKSATSVEAYMDATAPFRTDLYAASGGTLMTHAESIDLIKSLGGKFTPELKAPKADMPHDGMSQADYAEKLIDEYKAAGVPPEDVYPQSFNLDDVLYWIRNEPEFGRQAVYLDGRIGGNGLDPMDPETFSPGMSELKQMGVNIIAPPLWVLLTLEDGKIVPSNYALEARKAGLDIITWTLERSGPLNDGGGWYYRSITDAITSDGVMFEVLDVLAQDVGVIGVFSDWPATVSYYASCMDLN
jgi:glycerophosphoryl diester phosphodiesterase